MYIYVQCVPQTALISIRREIKDIEDGKYPQDNNLMVNAPHTQRMVSCIIWEAYSLVIGPHVCACMYQCQ